MNADPASPPAIRRLVFLGVLAIALSANPPALANPAIEDLFDDALAVQAGIAQASTIALSQALALRSHQEGLKAAIETLPSADREAWLDPFAEFVQATDDIVAARPLRVPVAPNAELLVRNHTDLFLAIVRHYKLMDQSSGEIDLTRFAGISADDVADLDTFQRHTAARTIGPAYSLPAFDLWSPLGNLQLLDRLVRKFAAHGIGHTVGPVEVVHQDILRYIDGTKPAFDQGLLAAATAFQEVPVRSVPYYVTTDFIPLVLADLQALKERIQVDVKAVIDGYEGEQVFADILRRDLAHAINYGTNGGPAYSTAWEQVDRALRENGAAFDVAGDTVRVSSSDLNSLHYLAPYNLDALLQYPGVAERLTPRDFAHLTSAAHYNSLNRVDLTPESPEETQPTDPATHHFCLPNRRYEVPELLLQTFADEVLLPNGHVDLDRLRAEMLLNPELEEALSQAERIIAQARTLMHGYDQQPALSPDDYHAMVALLADTQDQLRRLFEPLLENVVYTARSEVTARVQERFSALAAGFATALQGAHVAATAADGTALTVDPDAFVAHVLDPVLAATAIPYSYGGGYHRSAYLRLSGVEVTTLAGLRSLSHLSALQTFTFHPYEPPRAVDFFAPQEIRFVLVPRLIATMNALTPHEQTTHLTRELTLTVPVGMSLEQEIQRITRLHCSQARQHMAAIHTDTIDGLNRVRDLFAGVEPLLRRDLTPLLKGLSRPEIGHVEAWINWDWHAMDNLRDVREFYTEQVYAVSRLQAGPVSVPVSHILATPGFPHSPAYDANLFPGILPEDFAVAESASDYQQYNYFYFTPRPGYTTDTLSRLGQLQFVDALVRRVYELSQAPPQAGLPPVPATVFYPSSLGGLAVDPEEFRLYIKGVPAMIARVQGRAQELCDAAATEIETFRQDTLTVDQIMDLYATHVLGTRTSLVEMLAEEAGPHERNDAIRAEGPAAAAYQTDVFSRFVEIVGAADKAVELPSGQILVLPVSEITAALLAHLDERVDGSVAAHHLALFYGIGLHTVRGLHKLENYLGEQVVALPRNSEFVQIVSQVSELGFMQLAAHLVRTYEDQAVLPDGSIDIPALVAALQDKDLALQHLLRRAADLAAARQAELRENPDAPLTGEELERLQSVTDAGRVDLLALATDFLSGLPVNDDVLALKETLEQSINDLYAGIKAARSDVLGDRNLSFEVALDGVTHTLECELGPATVGRFVTVVEEYLAANPANPAQDDLYYSPYDDHGYPQYDGGEFAGRAGCFPMPMPIPVPVPGNLDDHPTEFAMTVLFARLVERFGDFVVTVDKDGIPHFDMGLFEVELLKTDSDRAGRRILAIQDQAYPQAEALISGARDADGVLPVTALPEITAFFVEVRERIEPYVPQAHSVANEVWGRFIELYEAELFDKELGVEVAGQRVAYSPRTLHDILMRAYVDGILDPALMAPFATLIEEGETTWEYNEFRTIHWWHPWFDGYYRPGLGAKETTAFDIQMDAPAADATGNFTLGDLLRLPAISGEDIAELEVAEIQYLALEIVDPVTLLGQLDMRALAPGSSASAGGMLSNYSPGKDSSFGGENAPTTGDGTGGDEEPVEELPNLDYKSFRFITFKLMPEILVALGLEIVDENGRVDPNLFYRAILHPDAEVNVEILSTAGRPAGAVMLITLDNGAFRLEAVAPPGYRFLHWQGDTAAFPDVTAPSVTLDTRIGADVAAVFERENGAPPPGAAEWEVRLQPGWNLVSAPLQPTNADAYAVFPLSEISKPLVTWSQAAYHNAENFDALTPYWVHWDGRHARNAEVAVALEGEHRATDTAPLTPGWNLITVSRDSWLPQDAHDISAAWRWNPETQQYEALQADEPILPGTAYWLFSDRHQTVPLM